MHITIETASYPLEVPFAITGHLFESTDVVRVTLAADGFVGKGEAVGVYYLGETANSMVEQLSPLAGEVGDLNRNLIQTLLPPGGARNALDCAFWDLGAKMSDRSVWEMLDTSPRELTTVFTLGIAEPAVMAERAAAAGRFPNLKIKLDGDRPIERLEAIRAARPDAELVIDVNQGWSFEALRDYLPHCQRLGIAMIEQPLARGADEALDGFESPVPLAADESCLHLGEFETTARRYSVINIKLDKCGGLTEGLAMVSAARAKGMDIMIGNMTGTSLSMAPCYVIGQYCRFIDIDGPLHLVGDVDHGLEYREGGSVGLPSAALWG